MFSSASPRILFLLSLFAVYFHSVLAQHARSLETRDAFSDSGLPSASWIWVPEPDLLTTAPTGTVALIKTFTTPAGKSASFASIAITVDNNYTLWVNGQPIGAGNDFQTAQVFTAALNVSTNVFSVLGSNTGTVSPNPAGLLAAILVHYADGSNQTVLSDNTWLASGSIPSDFPLPHDLSSFVQAEVATNYGSGPWGTSVAIPTPAPNQLNLTGSAWIWTTPNAASSAAVGSVGFRTTVLSPGGKTATSATVLLTADNTFQLLVNGQYIGSPPFDNNAEPGGSWEYAQRFTVTLAPSTNVFTVLATNFAAQQAGGGPSSAGLVAAIQVTFSDGSTQIVRTDGSEWLAAPLASASSFLSAADSSLAPAISSGLFGIAPWGQLSGISDALNVLMLPANNAAAVPTSPSTSSLSLEAPTSILPNNPSPSTPVPTGGARARVSSRIPSLLVFVLTIITFTAL
ncbi:hypothetical protein B0H12DRAFT_233046 [Mycena haematopus]|nr:hypothetical protein B0H12DRAFT_233046 [Mycena haematopus]